MSQIFNLKGERIPVTIIKSGPCFVTQILNKENVGYNAVQLGYIKVTKTKKLTKPQLGHFTKNNLPAFYYLKEYKTDLITSFTLGQEITVNIFKIGDKISVTGLSIGKGNCGNIKRNNFTRGPMSHGSKHHRLQGSLGAGTDPGRVFPGKRMAGRLGHTQCTISGLQIIDIDADENLIILKGNVPGKRGNLIDLNSQN